MRYEVDGDDFGPGVSPYVNPKRYLDNSPLFRASRITTPLLNPTGCIISQRTLRALIDLCRQQGIWLLSDEVYRLLGPGPQRHIPQVADLYERGLSLT